jgi:hypothetical protein
MTTELERLAERCEKATGPDREFDGEIAKALSPEREWHRFEDTWGARSVIDSAAFDMPDEFTRSLDAAMSLVLSDAGLTLDRSWIGGHESWECVIEDERELYVRARAATPALALTAAALRSRSVRGEGGA